MAKLVEVTIGNARYTVKTDADETYIQSVARYINGKMEEIQDKTKSVSTMNVIILAALNTADELFRERDKNRKKMEEIEDRSKDLIEMIEQRI
jgi:cell division protein ZapA